MAEKTEKATPKKLKDARKKGQVSKSQDFPSAFTFVTAIMLTLFSSGHLFKTLGGYIVELFTLVRSNSLDMESMGGALFSQALLVILTASIPLIIIVPFVGVLLNFLIIGPLFSLQIMKFDFKKLDPIQGIKNKFKIKVFVELIKSILKIIGAAGIIFYVIWTSVPEVVTTAAIPVYGSALVLDDFLRKVAIRVGVFFLAIAIFDLSFQRKNFAKEMKMEKFEVKQEYKDTEGDPQIKGKRRELFREIAYQEGPRAASRARAIVTNPNHIAVALGYETEGEEVPIILTMGQGPIADKIIQIALDAHVPIMRNVSLARELFTIGTEGDYIPRETYKAVAEILRWIESLEENPDINVELFR